MNKAKITTSPLKNILYHAGWHSIHFPKYLNILPSIHSEFPVRKSSFTGLLELFFQLHLMTAIIQFRPKHLEIKYKPQTVDTFQITLLFPSRSHPFNSSVTLLEGSLK